MVDPVICADGHSYERASIERWLAAHGTSPLTSNHLPYISHKSPLFLPCIGSQRMAPHTSPLTLGTSRPHPHPHPHPHPDPDPIQGTSPLTGRALPHKVTLTLTRTT